MSLPALRYKKGQALSDFYRKIKAFMVLRVDGRICCRACGHSHWECLQIDHLKNDGEKHRRKHHTGKSRPGGGNSTHQWILKHPKTAKKKLQLLCANCHQLKSIYGFVPEMDGDTEEQFTDLYQREETK